ncbi:MAG: ABC transporter substrate-binding protein [Actinomycetales bacterium]|nr:ABC transporter substrate-binding protein [Actinomycetales bacterium]
MSRRARLLLATLLLPLSLVTAACGGSSESAGSPTASSAGAGFPVTVSAANGQITVTSVPRRVVSLSPSATETLFAVGAGSQVVAVDDQSDFPAEAPKTSLSAFQPNAEAVAGHSPDLVVLAHDSNGVVKALTTLKIPVLLLPAPKTLSEAYTQMVTLGSVTGHVEAATTLVERTRSRIDAAAKAAAPVKGMRLYHELDPTYYSVTSETFLGDLYIALGLANIADQAEDLAGGYPKLSAEYIVKAAPDIITLADTGSDAGGQSPEKVAKRPAFADLPAVRSGRVIAVDADIASRWGPRIADYAEFLAKTLTTAGN